MLTFNNFPKLHSAMKLFSTFMIFICLLKPKPLSGRFRHTLSRETTTTTHSSQKSSIHDKEKDDEIGALFNHKKIDEWVFIRRNESMEEIKVAHLGSTVILDCKVFGDKQFGTITWSKMEDVSNKHPYSLLTVGELTYTDDDRFMVARSPFKHMVNFGLRIQSVTTEDSGKYGCQATTHPPQSIVVNLKVVEAFSRIVGAQNKFVRSGSQLHMRCVFKKATQKPMYTFWYHNNRMINYDEGVTVQTRMTHSTLTIGDNEAVTVDEKYDGNYTCAPHNVKHSSITVKVVSSDVDLDDKQPNIINNQKQKSKPGQSSSNLVSLRSHFNTRKKTHELGERKGMSAGGKPKVDLDDLNIDSKSKFMVHNRSKGGQREMYKETVYDDTSKKELWKREEQLEDGLASFSAVVDSTSGGCRHTFHFMKNLAFSSFFALILTCVT